MKSRHVLDLKPTQFALGIKEIEAKVEEFKKLSKKERRRFLRQKAIKVVESPNRELYVVDHHHLLFTIWCSGVKRVPVQIVKSYAGRKMSFVRFWNKLKRKNLCRLYDQFGDGPREPLYLPVDIRGLADDPYRSLSWAVREKGGYKGSTQTYAEFNWADFFREHKLLEREGRAGFDKAVKRGLKLAKSRGARKLPGYIGKS